VKGRRISERISREKPNLNSSSTNQSRPGVRNSKKGEKKQTDRGFGNDAATKKSKEDYGGEKEPEKTNLREVRGALQEFWTSGEGTTSLKKFSQIDASGGIWERKETEGGGE